jgi:hypothetical protein
MGANTPKANRSSRTVANQKLADGFQKHQALLTQLFIVGEPLTAGQLVTNIEEIVAVADRAVIARAAWLAAVQEDLVVGVAPEAGYHRHSPRWYVLRSSPP